MQLTNCDQHGNDECSTLDHFIWYKLLHVFSQSECTVTVLIFKIFFTINHQNNVGTGKMHILTDGIHKSVIIITIFISLFVLWSPNKETRQTNGLYVFAL